MKKDLIIEHYQNPKNWGELKTKTTAAYTNQSCGDGITIFLKKKDGKVEDVKFKGVGCSICIACGSLITEGIKGKSIEEIEKLGENYALKLIDMEEDSPRRNCAVLSMKAVIEALKK